MTTPQQWGRFVGATAIDANGDKIGPVGQVFLNDDTGRPEWVTVSTGLFGSRESVAPLYGAQAGDGELRLGVTRQMIKDAPSVGAEGRLDGTDLDALYQHYSGHL